VTASFIYWMQSSIDLAVLLMQASLTGLRCRCVGEFTQLLSHARSLTSNSPSSSVVNQEAPPPAAAVAAAAAAIRSSLPLLRSYTSQRHPLHSNAHDVLACISMMSGQVGQAVVESTEALRLLKLRSNTHPWTCCAMLSRVLFLVLQLPRPRSFSNFISGPPLSLNCFKITSQQHFQCTI
jgi:hypothetical protein